MSHRKPHPKTPCPYCGRLTSASHMDQHIPKCPQNPAVDRDCRHCGDEITGPARLGLCRRCYSYLYIHGVQRPLTEPDDDIDVDELPNIADVDIHDSPSGIAAIPGWRILAEWNGWRWVPDRVQRVYMLR